MSVSVIIPAYGDVALTTRAIETVKATCDAELVVVDNAKGADHPLVDNYLQNPFNRGFAVACNQGAYLASGEILVFLNNDTVPQQGWLAPLVDLAKIGHLAGGLLTYPDERIQHAGIRLYRDPHGVLTAENIHESGETRQVEAVTGACLAIHRHVFAHCGGFDVNFVNGYEDVSLCLMARALGYECWFTPDSVVVHEESASGPERWTHVGHNIARLQALWGDIYGRE